MISEVRSDGMHEPVIHGWLCERESISNQRLSKKDVEKAKKLNFVMPDPDPVSPSLNNEWRF